MGPAAHFIPSPKPDAPATTTTHFTAHRITMACPGSGILDRVIHSLNYNEERNDYDHILANQYYFTTRRLDDESKLYLYRNRYYHSGLGRFVSRDPVGYADSMNLYEYVLGNPTGHADPSGLLTVHNDSSRGTFDGAIQRLGQSGGGTIWGLTKIGAVLNLDFEPIAALFRDNCTF